MTAGEETTNGAAATAAAHGFRTGARGLHRLWGSLAGWGSRIPGVVRYRDTPAPVTATNGMVVTTDELASQVGVDVLRSGGNAMDAAVAVMFALAVVNPEAGTSEATGFWCFGRRTAKRRLSTSAPAPPRLDPGHVPG